MAKGDRKRTKKSTPEPQIVDRTQASPLMQSETIYFNELVEISNTFGKLKQQYDQYTFIKKTLEERRVKVQKGTIGLPVQIQLSQGMFYTEGSKKKVLENLDEQIKTIKTSIKGIQNQVENHRDAFVESGLRLQQFAERRFGMYKVKTFAPRGVSATENDKELLEKEYDELFKADKKDMMKPEVQTAFKEAMKTAAKKNSACKCNSCKTKK